MDSVKATSAMLEKENVSLKEDLLAAHKENSSLKEDLMFSANRATVVARWEIMKEWKDGKAEEWDLSAAEEEYREVKTIDIRIQGLSPPVFEAPVRARITSKVAGYDVFMTYVAEIGSGDLVPLEPEAAT
ncbi:hypothetical protein EUTSA_v10002724mg [Eutrema salsugineum]|uniref:Uncharacterized protein n=2 Tax=Eutrema salsugineum TaxID=72664 RepID=V4KIF0_EUTSA|nr:hypothetical protein EUTSA_v10002724mg [Eutrema salsugineum]